MNRPATFLAAALLGTGPAGCIPRHEPAWTHRDAIVVDAHARTPGRLLDDRSVDFGRRTDGPVNLPRLIQGGVDVQFFAVGGGQEMTWERAIEGLDRFKRAMERHDRIRPALSARHVRRLIRHDRIAVVLAIEGGEVIKNRPAQLRALRDLGVRSLTLTSGRTTNWADAAAKPVVHGGLTPFGREIVRDMNRLGMIIDVTHASEQTFWDVLEVSDDPVIVSHAGVRALCPNPENLTDDQIRGLAGNGGVLCITFSAAHLHEKAYTAIGEFEKMRDWQLTNARLALRERPAALAAKRRQIEAAHRARVQKEVNRPPIDAVIDHIMHVVELVGPDHVGIGSNFDGAIQLADHLDGSDSLPMISERLLHRGLKRKDVQSIMGENVQRIIERVMKEE